MTGLGPKLPGFERAQRPRRVRNPPGNGRVSLYRGRQQGNPARRGQGRPNNPARRRRSHPDQARWNRPGGRLNRRMQSASTCALGERTRSSHSALDDDSKKWPNSLTHHIVGGPLWIPISVLDLAISSSSGHGRPQGRGRGSGYLLTTKTDSPPSIAEICSSAIGASRPSLASSCSKAGGTFAVSRRSILVSKGDCAELPPILAGSRRRWREPLPCRLGLRRLPGARPPDRPRCID